MRNKHESGTKLILGGKQVCLWRDPIYSEITFSSPDILERSLLKSVGDGKTDYALTWYQKRYPQRKKKTRGLQDLLVFQNVMCASSFVIKTKTQREKTGYKDRFRRQDKFE